MVRGEAVVVAVFGTVGGLLLGTLGGWAVVRTIGADQGIGRFDLPVDKMAVVIALGALAGVLAARRPAKRGWKARRLRGDRHELTRQRRLRPVPGGGEWVSVSDVETYRELLAAAGVARRRGVRVGAGRRADRVEQVLPDGHYPRLIHVHGRRVRRRRGTGAAVAALQPQRKGARPWPGEAYQRPTVQLGAARQFNRRHRAMPCWRRGSRPRRPGRRRLRRGHCILRQLRRLRARRGLGVHHQ